MAGVFYAAVLPITSPVPPTPPAPAHYDCVDPGSQLPLVLVHAIGEEPVGLTDEIVALADAVDLVRVPFGTPPGSWVDDQAGGPKLVELVICLAARSQEGGGLGVVAISAASTGTFVTRWALHQLDAIGRLSAVAGVVALGSSDAGFWVGGSDDPSLTQTQRDLRRLFVSTGSASCEREPSVVFDTLCQRTSAPDSPFVVNTALGSPAMDDLPPWPDGLPLLRIGGRLNLTTNVFGELSLPLGDVGDGAVNTPTEPGATLFDCQYNLITVHYADDTSCAHTQLSSLRAVAFSVGSFVNAIRSQLKPSAGAFVLYCDAGSGERMYAVLPLAPGSEVTAAASGFRTELRFAEEPDTAFFQYGPDEPGRGGAPRVGQNTITVWGDIEFDENIVPGDRIRKGQIIGHVSNSPRYRYFEGSTGTVHVEAHVTPEARGFIPSDNDYLASLYPFDVPTICSPIT